MDQAIEALVFPCPDNVAVVAIGGYGRGELSLFSDIDLMVLHELEDPSEIAAGLFRPLWDARLRVGHAVRTVREASAAAKESFDTQTTLLTGRLIVGDQELFDRVMDEVAAVTRARPLRRHLVSEEQERRRKSPYLLMATDVKNGRGGLRTLHGFEWEQRREALIGRFTASSDREEAAARETLLRVRNALHAVSGRAHDVFSLDYREQVGRWLGVAPFDVAADLVEAMETVDSLAARRWPEVVEEGPRRIWQRPGGRRRSPTITGPPNLDQLVAILQFGQRGRVVFDRLWSEGQLDAVLPEWEVVRALPQLAPFHDHPVAAHLWRTVDEMVALIDEDDHFGEIAEELARPDLLVLSAFLHDIGKGHGGSHAEVGAGIAESFGRRMGMPDDDVTLVTEAVRHHLLLPTTATRRDLDDPAVVEEVAGVVGDLRLLQVLYLLTAADSRATGPTMWNAWKATLVRTLFVRCAGYFDGQLAEMPATTREEVLAVATGSGLGAEAERHIDGMPVDYLRTVDPDDFVWHLRLIQGITDVSNLGVSDGDPADTTVVVGWRRPGFRRKVAEVFAANGIDVLEARLMSRGDGLLVDTYRVVDDRTGDPVRPEKWDRVRTAVEAGLIGEIDTTSALSERVAAYGAAEGAVPSARAGIDPATGDLLLTVKCGDRVGRLAEVLAVLESCDLEIRLAKIDSRGGEVVDTFHVAAGGWGGEDLSSLAERVGAAISL